MPRLPNPRHVKVLRNYTVEEAAKTVDAHKNTVRRWIKDGLPTIDNRRPSLILGSELRAFLDARRERAKRPCPPGFMFCFKCRAPRRPASGMIDYEPRTLTSGNVSALCSVCSGLMYRRMRQTDFARLEATLADDGDARIVAPKRAAATLPE